MRRRALKQKKMWNPALFGIRNPLSWNPESSTRNPESTGWNPESKTVMDSLTWGEECILNRPVNQKPMKMETAEKIKMLRFAVGRKRFVWGFVTWAALLSHSTP